MQSLKYIKRRQYRHGTKTPNHVNVITIDNEKLRKKAAFMTIDFVDKR